VVRGFPVVPFWNLKKGKRKMEKKKKRGGEGKRVFLDTLSRNSAWLYGAGGKERGWGERRGGKEKRKRGGKKWFMALPTNVGGERGKVHRKEVTKGKKRENKEKGGRREKSLRGAPLPYC